MQKKLMVQKVPTRSVMLARAMCKAEADSAGVEVPALGVPALGVPAFFTVGLDMLRLVWIEIGHLEPDVGDEGHPLGREYLDALRVAWADDDTEQALIDARNEAAMWKRMHSDLLDKIRAILRGERDEGGAR